MSRNNIFSVEQAADILGVGRSAVIKYIARGKLSAVKVGPVWTISQDDLDAFDPPARAGRKPQGLLLCSACRRRTSTRYADPMGGSGRVCRQCWEERKKKTGRPPQPKNHWSVIAQDGDGNTIETVHVPTRLEAEKRAKAWAKMSDRLALIRWTRDDGTSGYLNRDGYADEGRPW